MDIEIFTPFVVSINFNILDLITFDGTKRTHMSLRISGDPTGDCQYKYPELSSSVVVKSGGPQTC